LPQPPGANSASPDRLLNLGGRTLSDRQRAFRTAGRGAPAHGPVPANPAGHGQRHHQPRPTPGGSITLLLAFRGPVAPDADGRPNTPAPRRCSSPTRGTADARASSAAGASRTGTWALAHGRKRPRGVVHAALSRARFQPSETLVVERKQVVTAELVRRSRLVQRGTPRRLARGWWLRACRRSPVPAGSRWRRAVASPRARPSAADEGGRPLPAALHFSSYTAQKALMRP
jgi:hypothetical protein